jgi:hypothetical protein
MEGFPCPIEFPTEFCETPGILCMLGSWTTVLGIVWVTPKTRGSVSCKPAELWTPLDAMQFCMFYDNNCWRAWDWSVDNRIGRNSPWFWTWGGILWDAVQDKRQKGKPVRKKEGTEQGRQIKHRQFTHKVMSERTRMDLIQSIKVLSDNFQGWGKKRRLKTKIIW